LTFNIALLPPIRSLFSHSELAKEIPNPRAKIPAIAAYFRIFYILKAAVQSCYLERAGEMMHK
jgi:hypothetical protein